MTRVDLDAPIEETMRDLFVSPHGVRMRGTLLEADILTLRTLLATPPAVLLRIPWFGLKSLRLIEEWLAARGVKLDTVDLGGRATHT
jgi:hypothetical protein